MNTHTHTRAQHVHIVSTICTVGIFREVLLLPFNLQRLYRYITLVPLHMETGNDITTHFVIVPSAAEDVTV